MTAWVYLGNCHAILQGNRTLVNPRRLSRCVLGDCEDVNNYEISYTGSIRAQNGAGWHSRRNAAQLLAPTEVIFKHFCRIDCMPAHRRDDLTELYYQEEKQLAAARKLRLEEKVLCFYTVTTVTETQPVDWHINRVATGSEGFWYNVRPNWRLFFLIFLITSV